jgi:hypothetical protein
VAYIDNTTMALNAELKALIDKGQALTKDDIPDGLLLRLVINSARDNRRPTVKAAAIKQLLELKGLTARKLGQPADADPEDEIEATFRRLAGGNRGVSSA